MKLLAALIFFTRLALWRWVDVPPGTYSRIIAWWPAAGWVSAALCAGVLFGAGQLFPLPVAVLLALSVRMLLTGALHEDGLADFFDGFGGGGSDRTLVLTIMKDSRTGTYGVIALLIYFGLLVSLLSSLPLAMACLAILCGDPLSKGISAQLVNLLPYARTLEESKSKMVYERLSPAEWCVSLFFGLLPLALLLEPRYWWAALAPGVMLSLLCVLMKRRIGGYTGDCCGAVCLLGELAFYLTLVGLWSCC